MVQKENIDGPRKRITPHYKVIMPEAAVEVTKGYPKNVDLENFSRGWLGGTELIFCSYSYKS